MAISGPLRSALRALSYSADIEVEKSYKLERKLKLAAGRRAQYKAWDHLVWGGDHEIPVRLFSPGVGAIHELLIFFHGGGWVSGNIESYSKICLRMARLTRCLVASVDYRLAPEFRFPAAPEDCYAATKELFYRASLLGANPEKIILIGDSAGGNLAAAVSLMARDRGDFCPAAQILIYPAVHYDHSETSPFPSVRENGEDYLLTSRRINEYMSLYASGEQDYQNPYFSPLCAQDLSNQPDTFILTAEFDPLRDEGEAYAAALRAAGNRVELYRMEDALHGFLSLSPRFPLVRDAYALMSRFLHEQEARR